MEVVRSRRVDASPAAVWAVLADFAGISRWAPNVDHSCLLSEQTAGVGTVRRIQTGRTALLERVTDWEEPSVLAYRIEGLPPLVRSVCNRWTIEAAGQGSMVALCSTIEAGPRPAHRVAARAVARRLGSASDDMLSGLASHAELQGKR